jgi:two-component system invasion response regulator UvrY
MSEPNGPIRVVLIDDHAMVRQALSSVLEDDSTVRIVAQGGDAVEAIEVVRREKPDVLVLDYNIPGGGALAVLETLERLEIDVVVLVLTVHESSHYAVRALEAGAQGFLVKSSAVEELLGAIRAVHAGEIYITPKLSRVVLDQLRKPRRDRVGVAALSARELEILRILASGTGIKEAAGKLKVSVSTASTYRARLMKKLNLESTSDLIRFALENNLVT